MEQVLLHKEEEENRKYGIFASIGVHLLLLLLFLIPCLSYMDPPPDLQGIVVVFGEENAGDPQQTVSTESAAAAAAKSPSKPEPKEVKKSEPVAKFEKQIKEEPTPTKVESKTVQEVAEVQAVKEKVIETSKEEPVKKVEEVVKEVSKPTVPTKSQAEIEAEQKKKKYEEAKSQFGNMFGKSTSSSKGEVEGQQGDPLGKPDAKALEGISKGSGRVGGGLSNRGVVYEPKFSDDSQKSGIVVIKICVDTNGKVINAKFTQKGSTTTDSYLVGLAEKQVLKYKFTQGSSEEQCGTITVDFKLQ